MDLLLINWSGVNCYNLLLEKVTKDLIYLGIHFPSRNEICRPWGQPEKLHLLRKKCLPGTVSGKVSFCIVCIAFNAFRALYHLKRFKVH